MDWLGRSMQCNFVTEITEKSCVDAQFSNKNYKEQTVNIPPNVVIEAFTSSIQKRPAGMKATQIDIQCTSIVHLPNQICLPPLSLYLGAYVSESLHLSIVVDAYGPYPNERTNEWLTERALSCISCVENPFSVGLQSLPMQERISHCICGNMRAVT